MKKTLILGAVFCMMSCNNEVKTIDLAKIDFNKNAKEYLEGLNFYSKETQNGHYEIKSNGENVSLDLVDNGERIIKYVFTEEVNTKQLNYDGLNIDKVFGAKVFVYQTRIAFVSINIDKSSTIEFIKKLKKELGTESEILYNTRLDKTFSQGLLTNLSNISSDFIKKEKDELGNDVISSPQNIIWQKNDLIYQLTLDPLGDSIKSTLNIITKKALKDRVILGYHNVTNDPILKKYIN